MTAELLKKLDLPVDGLGILLYSPASAAHIQSGEDYFAAHYADEAQVQTHVQRGTLVGVGTGSPGDFVVELLLGAPDDATIQRFEYKYRVGLEVRDRTLCVRDLLDLSEWEPQCPDDQCVHLESGYYRGTLLSSRPGSGVVGDGQLIQVYLEATDQMPELAREGIPYLGP
jgi:hypothetical protein